MATRPCPAPLLEAISRLRTLAEAPDWASPDLQNVLYRLLLCAPFTEFDVRRTHPDLTHEGRHPPRARGDAADAPDPGPVPDMEMPVSQALGRIFDNLILPPACLRPVANLWVRWSHSHIYDLAGVHRCGDSGIPASPSKFVPCPLCHVRVPAPHNAPRPDIAVDEDALPAGHDDDDDDGFGVGVPAPAPSSSRSPSSQRHDLAPSEASNT